MRIAKKYLLLSGLGRKKVGLTRVRIAKKIHSSLLSVRGIKETASRRLKNVMEESFGGEANSLDLYEKS